MDIRETQLYQAATEGDLTRFTELLSSGSCFRDRDIFQPGKNLSDPENESDQNKISQLLRIAFFQRHLAIIEHLLQQPSLKELLGRPNCIADVGAVMTGDPEVVRLIAKANPTFATEYKKIGHCLPSAVKQSLWLPRDKCLPVLKVLVEYGARFDVKSDYMWLACQRQTLETVEFLEKRGCVHLVPELYPKLALISGAASYGNIEMVRWFLENGADVNSIHQESYPEWHSGPPIWAAAHGGHAETVELLLQHGADPNIPTNASNYQGETALQAARRGGHHDIVQLLESRFSRIFLDWH